MQFGMYDPACYAFVVGGPALFVNSTISLLEFLAMMITV